MQLTLTLALTLLSFFSFTNAQAGQHALESKTSFLSTRDANPMASACAEAVADAHPHDIDEIHYIFARAAEAAKTAACKRELSPRCFGNKDGTIHCNPGRTVLPPSTEHGNPIPIDCNQIATCKRMQVTWRGHAANAVPAPALNACRRVCVCE